MRNGDERREGDEGQETQRGAPTREGTYGISHSARLYSQRIRTRIRENYRIDDNVWEGEENGREEEVGGARDGKCRNTKLADEAGEEESCRLPLRTLETPP